MSSSCGPRWRTYCVSADGENSIVIIAGVESTISTMLSRTQLFPWAVVVLALVTLAASVDVHRSKQQQNDALKVLSPLLAKYEVHKPLVYTDEGLKDTLETIQTKILEEFRSLEQLFDARVKQEEGNVTEPKLAPLEAPTNALNVTLNTTCPESALGNRCRAYQQYLFEKGRRDRLKDIVFQKKVAQRRQKKEILERAESMSDTVRSNEYQNADAMLGLTESSMENILEIKNNNTQWAKAALLKESLELAKVLATDNKLAELIDSLH